MADDYSTNKRKFDDPDATLQESTRRATGFSAPIALPGSALAEPQLELAKQKAQEIAARLYNSAVKPENGDNPAYSNDYAQNPTGQPAQSQYFMSTYGSQSSSKTIEIPNGRVGVLIGKGGETIKYLQAQSGAKIQITRDADAIPFSQTRSVDITGSSEQVNRAEQLINDVLAEADVGGSGVLAARKVGSMQYGGEQFSMKVPTNKVGLVIGKGGETIKSMQAKSGARIQVIPLHPPPGDTSLERTVQIDGTNEQIEAAKQLVNEVISGENRMRNQAVSGGYSQQSYQPPPQPPMWTPPPQQQPLPPPAANYYAQQSYPQYGGYPPPQQAGYDYYNTPQQQQLPVTAAPTDTNTAYNYSNAYGDGTTYPQQQAYAAYPPQDGGANSTAAAATQGYNGQQQAGYYSQPGYGYGYGFPQAPAAYNSTDATTAAAPSASPAAASKTNPADS